MASIINLFVDAAEKIKCILTTQEFGAEYEIVCSELRLQWLRFRLWGESVVNLPSSTSHIVADEF